MKKYLMSLIVLIVIAGVAIGVLLGKIEDLEAKNAALLQELNASQTLATLLEEERVSLEGQLTALEAEHAALTTEHAALVVQMEQISADFAALQTTYDTLNADYAVVLAKATALEGYQEQSELLATQLTEITLERDALAAENLLLNEQAALANEKITALTAQVEQLKGRIAIIKQMKK